MRVTNLWIKVAAAHDERLRAYVRLELDRSLIIHDLKLIHGPKGLFVCMPSRQECDHCPDCEHKNPLRANYCQQCGLKLQANRVPIRECGRPKLTHDLVHPISRRLRDRIHQLVLEGYELECELIRQADYICSYDDIEAVSTFQRLQQRNAPRSAGWIYSPSFGVGVFDGTV